MNNFDSNRAIHGDMINYVVLSNDGAYIVRGAQRRCRDCQLIRIPHKTQVADCSPARRPRFFATSSRHTTALLDHNPKAMPGRKRRFLGGFV
jgi:hypothetical protein